MNCIANFTDFCPKDRFLFIGICLLLLLAGFIIGKYSVWGRER